MDIWIIPFLLGVFLIFLGIANMKGNISTLHKYHRHRVSEEDMLPFGKRVGLGTIIIGAAVITSILLKAAGRYTGMAGFDTAGDAVIIAGLVIGLGLSFYAMIRYNKGIF